uniref:Transmembrane protein 62 n=1 Tax=Phallusia mammillata TaxID=59560 RepID=A0A6F9DVS9_9ASCI|nr:transmembrane protein 62 [Phallusia mammillata]
MLLLRIAKYSVFFTIIYLLFLAVTLYKPHHLSKSEWMPTNPPYPSNKASNLFWFVQVSDIHISRFYDKTRGPDFKSFCSTTLSAINPEVVLVTGDLTDAKHKNLYDSEQFLDEWQTYNKVLQDTKVLDKFVWLDVRGNHDVFNILSDDSPANYYASLSGSKGKLSSTTWNLVKPYGKYSFIPVDASIMPGPRRPYNFMGHLSSDEVKKLQIEGERSRKSNMTIWYGHYPTPTVSSSAAVGLRSVLGHFGAVYLCGHMHDLGGLFPHLQAMHPSGFLELEVKDWKWNRYYRVIAVDHDLISYVDMPFNQWPVVLISNPKPARDMIPKHEPIGRIKKSSHIRFLAFSTARITKTSVAVDGVITEEASHVEGPLWVCKWDPSLFKSGVHVLNVTVEDESGATNSHVSRFSLDDEWPIDFSFSATVILLTDFCTIAKTAFASFIAIAVTTIMLVKRYGVQIPNENSFIQLWLFRLQLLISDNFTFYALIVFLLNLAIGPHFIGEIVTGHIGACFVYGLLIEGQLVSEYLLYAHSISIFIFHYTTAIIYLSYCAEVRWMDNFSFKQSFQKRKTWLFHILFLHVVLCHCYSCLEVYLSYGTLSLLLSPAKLWWSLMFIVLTLRTWMCTRRIQRRVKF